MKKLWKHKSVLAHALKQLNLAKYKVKQAETAFREANKECSKAFRIEREASGISLRQMAKNLEISAPYLSDIELGRRNFPEFWNTIKVKI